jgi:ankyrin repeat protein
MQNVKTLTSLLEKVKKAIDNVDVASNPTLLIMAIIYQDFNLCLDLVKAGANVNSTKHDMSDKSPLHLALTVYSDIDEKIVKLLYNAGAKLNLTSSTKEYATDLTEKLKDITEDKEPTKEESIKTDFTMHVEVVEIDIVNIAGDHHDIAE